MKIKHFFTLAIIAMAAVNGLAQGTTNTSASAIDKFFSSYVEDKRFNVVYISPKLFQMIGRIDTKILDMEDDAEAKAVLEMAKDLQGLRILTTKETPQALYKEAKSKINTKEYEVLLTVRNKEGNNVEFLIKESNNLIQELLLLSSGEEEFVLLSFMGNFDLNKITRLAKEIEKK